MLAARVIVRSPVRSTTSLIVEAVVACSLTLASAAVAVHSAAAQFSADHPTRTSNVSAASQAPTSSSAVAQPTAESAARSNYARSALSTLPPAATTSDGGRFSGKVQRYAVRLMSQYDLNGDRLLEQSEWVAMHGDPAGTMDVDGDGVITTEEIIKRVSTFGRRSLRVVPNVPVRVAEQGTEASESEPTARMTYRVLPDESAAADAASTVPANSPEVRMMRRFFVTPSQMPQGIAGWFLDNDADGDGQVTMAEFSANWTEVEASRFSNYDQNGDGVITAAECARAENERLSKEAAASESEPVKSAEVPADTSS